MTAPVVPLMSARLKRLWDTPFPWFLPVVHTAEPYVSTNADLARAVDETIENVRIVAEAGADGVFFINQNINVSCFIALVEALCDCDSFQHLPMGINLLGLSLSTLVDAGRTLDVDMLWADEAAPGLMLPVRAKFPGPYFGGVGFKYQRDLPPDGVGPALAACAGVVDFVTTSGYATGVAPPREKLDFYADRLLPGQRLAVASGMSEENLEELVLDDRREGGLRVHAVLVASSIEASVGKKVLVGKIDREKAQRMGKVFERIKQR